MWQPSFRLPQFFFCIYKLLQANYSCVLLGFRAEHENAFRYIRIAISTWPGIALQRDMLGEGV